MSTRGCCGSNSLTRRQLVGWLSAATVATPRLLAGMAGDNAAGDSLPLKPPQGYAAAALKDYQARLVRHFGDSPRDVPLEVKAEFYEWALFHYLWRPNYQVYDWATLPDDDETPPAWVPCSDTSTWNGALLCGLSYKYAVTRNPRTLVHIASALLGMRRCLEASGKPGLIYRSVNRDDGVFHDNMTPYIGFDGSPHHCWDDPAKGTFNQVVGGYGKLMMHAWDHLPADARQMARDDLAAMILHVIDHDYRLTNADGSRTSAGDITPLVGTVGVPFNAQVAYQIVATGYCFPPEDPAAARRVAEQYVRLRGEHHVYYEHPWRNLVRPQEVAASPFVKGMNDRAHAIYAAFAGMELELDRWRRHGEPFDGKFMYRLGQTLVHGMRYLRDYHNALCQFMWAGILADPAVQAAVLRGNHDVTPEQLANCVRDGVETLRRFPLDRFHYEGEEVEIRRPRWVDEYHPGYNWHQPQLRAWRRNGRETNALFAAFDYLHAYWLFRYYRLPDYPTR